MKFNIYAGIGGSFGGATYQGTGEYETLEAAEQDAYELAREEYECYSNSLPDWYEVADEEGLDYNENEAEIDELYNDLVESWISYYAVLTEEDNLTEKEIFEL